MPEPGVPPPRPVKRSRYQVLAEIRRVFVRHWLDPEALTLTLSQQALRIGGTLRGTGPDGSAAIDASLFEVLEAELCRVPEVGRVQLDLRNWRRDASGRWLAVERKKPRSATSTGPADCADSPGPSGAPDSSGPAPETPRT